MTNERGHWWGAVHPAAESPLRGVCHPTRVLDVNKYRRGRGFIWVLTCCGRGPDVRPSTPLEHRGCFVLDVCQLDGATFVLERSAFCVELCPHETAAVARSPPIQVHGPTARVQRGVRPLNQCASAKMSACLLQCPPIQKKEGDTLKKYASHTQDMMNNGS